MKGSPSSIFPEIRSHGYLAAFLFLCAQPLIQVDGYASDSAAPEITSSASDIAQLMNYCSENQADRRAREIIANLISRSLEEDFTTPDRVCLFRSPSQNGMVSIYYFISTEIGRGARGWFDDVSKGKQSWPQMALLAFSYGFHSGFETSNPLHDRSTPMLINPSKIGKIGFVFYEWKPAVQVIDEFGKEKIASPEKLKPDYILLMTADSAQKVGWDNISHVSDSAFKALTAEKWFDSKDWFNTPIKAKL